MKNIDNLPEILTAKDISEVLRISYNSTLKLIKYNITYLKLGNTYRVTKINFIKFDHKILVFYLMVFNKLL